MAHEIIQEANRAPSAAKQGERHCVRMAKPEEAERRERETAEKPLSFTGRDLLIRAI
jgi:hypothetical protein